MRIFGKIEGPVLGDYVRLEKSHNTALVELLLAAQAKKSLPDGGRIILFRGKDVDGEYMGWRTVTDPHDADGLEVIGEHVV